MATEFKLPNLGENIDSGDVLSILVAVGDTVAVDQEVIELETDKATLPVPCSASGKVTAIHIAEGDTISVGQLIFTLQESGASASPSAAKTAPASVASTPQTPASKPKAPVASTTPSPAAVAPVTPTTPIATPTTLPASVSAKPVQPAPHAAISAAASPSNRRLARELGVDISQVYGSGEGGRVTREDIFAEVKNSASPSSSPAPAPVKHPAVNTQPTGTLGQDAWGVIHTDKLSKIRKTIALNMLKSTTSIPHVTNFDDADVTELEAMRKSVKDDFQATGLKLTSMPLLLRAVAIALQKHPTLNASIDMDNNQIIYKDYINIGVAIDSERGLVVPNLRNADQLSIAQLAGGLGELVNKVRNKKFTLDDLRGGTFTISNLGAIGGTYSTPVINSPEVAILLVGRSRLMPMVRPDGSIAARLMMPMSLSYDHRLVDGADAARFLNELKMLLESPGRLVMGL